MIRNEPPARHFHAGVSRSPSCCGIVPGTPPRHAARRLLAQARDIIVTATAAIAAGAAAAARIRGGGYGDCVRRGCGLGRCDWSPGQAGRQRSRGIRRHRAGQRGRLWRADAGVRGGTIRRGRRRRRDRAGLLRLACLSYRIAGGGRLVIIIAEKRPIPQFRRRRSLRFVGRVEIASIRGCLARRERAHQGHKGGENKFHARDGNKLGHPCQPGTPEFVQPPGAGCIGPGGFEP